MAHEEVVEVMEDHLVAEEVTVVAPEEEDTAVAPLEVEEVMAVVRFSKSSEFNLEN